MIIKRSFTLLSILGLCSTSIAYATTNVSPLDANYKGSIYKGSFVDSQRYEFNIGPVWLKPGASNLNYVIYNKELPTQSPSWEEREIKPNFTSGLQLGFRYIFPNASNDVSLNWTHLSTTTSTAIFADGVSYFLGPDYQIGPLAIPIRNATGNAKFKYDVINLDAGQFINFGTRVQMRVFGGLSAGFLREQVVAQYSGTRNGIFAGPFNLTQDVYSNFSGVGPRAGFRADVYAGGGFGFLGEAAVSALIGSQAARTDFNASATELLVNFGQAVNSQTINDQPVYQVIPGLDAKLGLEYKYLWTKHNALITLSTGYQAAVYVNAISQYLPQTLVLGQGLETGGIFVATMAHKLSNYSVQGPFLNLAVAV